MDIQHVLFSPKGRIGPRTFLRGFILLTGVFILVQVASTFLAPGIGVAAYAMIFPYVCVFSKRLHDAGQSGWLYPLFLLAYVVIGSVAGMFLMPFLSPEAYQMNLEFQQALQGEGLNSAFSSMTEQADELSRKSALTTLASFLVTSAILGFAGAKLPSDPDSNRYGPPEGRNGISKTFS